MARAGDSPELETEKRKKKKKKKKKKQRSRFSIREHRSEQGEGRMGQGVVIHKRNWKISSVRMTLGNYRQKEGTKGEGKRERKFETHLGLWPRAFASTCSQKKVKFRPGGEETPTSIVQRTEG